MSVLTKPRTASLQAGLSMADYLEHPALSRTALDKIALSPAHYRYYVDFGDEDTPARKQGRVLHNLLLEPESFEQNVAVWRGGRRQGKAWEAFAEEHEGREIITTDEEETFQAIRKSFEARASTKDVLKDALIEQSLFFEYEGVQCKGRPDIIRPGIVYDVKTAESASFEAFQRDAYKWGYHRQAAWYLHGLKALFGELDFAFIVIEKKPPHEIAVYYCSSDFIERGRDENRVNLARYKTCVKTNTWPGYPDVMQPLSLPRWVQ